MKFSENRSGILFYLIQSSYDINLYNPRYLRVSWWTLRQFKMKRIPREISENDFSDARHVFCQSASCCENPTAPGLL